VTPAVARELLRTRVSTALAEHCEAVAAYAVELVRRWGGEEEEAAVAGLLHDYCRELGAIETLRRARELGLRVSRLEKRRPVQLLHARLAAAELTDSGLSAACLRAIALHTVGGPRMSVLDKCVYVADGAAAGRRHEGVERVRAFAAWSLDDAVRASVRGQLAHLLQQGEAIHPHTLALYNELHD
jgi:predicted HD superfamily hydrolase involved in NAD metabolism